MNIQEINILKIKNSGFCRIPENTNFRVQTQTIPFKLIVCDFCTR